MQEFIHVFYRFIPLDHEIYKCKKSSNLIKDISSHNTCSGIKSQQVNKNICHSVPKTLDFSQNSSVLFHQVAFDHFILCVLLIDKTNESCQNSTKFERNVISTAKKKKKAFKKKRKQYYTSKDKCPNFTNFFRMPKINNSNLLNEKQEQLKMKLGQLQEEISKASLPVSADLSNDNYFRN